MKKLLLILIINCSIINAFAGTFNWKAKIEPVEVNSFYNIKLLPDVTRHLQNNFQDIRIYDESGNEIPYMLGKERPVPYDQLYRNLLIQNQYDFHEYEIIYKKHNPYCCTELILHNKKRKSIRSVSLMIKNSDVRKRVKLTGSNDQKNWYVIKDNYVFNSIYSSTALSEIKIMDFPLIDYRYLKIVIDDSRDAPINILKTGYYSITQFIHNENKKAINNMVIKVKGVYDTTQLTLMGSDDKSNWLTIKEEIIVRPNYTGQRICSVNIDSIPINSYKFYKLVKADSKGKTVNIYGAGYYDIASENEKVSALPNPTITQFDSLSTKTTYVQISFDQMEYVDKIRIETTGPKFYKRRARLCTKKIVKVKQREEKTYFQTIKHIELVSDKETVIRFSDYPAKELFLIIDNNDNQPLKVNSINVSKFNHYLTSYLENDKQYVIKFGNNKIGRPVYDIAYFKSHIPKIPQGIHTTDIVDLRKEKRTIITSFLNDKAWIWIAIIVVIGVLGALSMKMIKEMDYSSG